MSRILITLGIILLLLGLTWPWLQKLGLFRLPGDSIIERQNFRLYFPITSMIILSLGFSLLVWLFRR